MPVYRRLVGASSEDCDPSNHERKNPQTVPSSVADLKVPEQLEQFLKLHKNGIKYMQCDQCPFICRPLSSLFLQHYSIHFATEPHLNPLLDCQNTPLPIEQFISVNEESLPRRERVIHECHLCHKRFYKLLNYRRHLQTKHRPAFKCTLCSCTYRTKMAFEAHCLRHARPKTTFHCEQCGRLFHSKDGFKYHLKNTCVQHECHKCKCNFNSRLQLGEHLQEVHKIGGISSSEIHLQAQLFQKENVSTVVKCVCFICGKVVKEMNLKRHLKVHLEERPFTCDLCGKCFKLKNALRDHIMTEMGMKDYVCEICGRKFVKRCYLNKHVRQHLSNQKNSTATSLTGCDLCGAHFSEQDQLSVHRHQQHNEPYTCELCGQTFPSKVPLSDHQLTELICCMCQEIFPSNEWLKIHVTAAHQLETYRKFVSSQDVASGTKSTSSFVYPCDVCGRKFCTEEKYSQHIAAEIKCELCENVAFDCNAKLKEHVESVHNLLEYRKVVHLRWRKSIKIMANGSSNRGDSDNTRWVQPLYRQPNQQEYTCNVCGKKLFYKRTFLLHKRMHTGQKPYRCEHCGKAYVSKLSLKAHLVAEMNLRKYACVHCDKRYNFQADLLAHVKQCHEKRQFSCHVCGKEFGLLRCLNDHLTVHSSIKPFACDKCNISFRLKKFLVRHIKKYHKQREQNENCVQETSTEIVVEG